MIFTSSGMEEGRRSAANVVAREIRPSTAANSMPVEIDFLGLDQNPPQQQPPARSNFVKPSSIRDIQKAASRLSPDLLRSVISGHSNHPLQSVPISQSSIRTASLAFLYNGSVSVFQTAPDAAENVMKMAAKGITNIQQLQQQRGFLMKEFNPHGDMPLFRKKSLQRFFEKRRERLKSVAPYPASSCSDNQRSSPSSSSTSSSSSC